MQGNAPLGQAGLARLGLLGLDQLGIQNLQAAPTEHRQRAVRRHAPDGFLVIEIVAEFGDFRIVFLLASHQAGAQQPLLPEPLAQRLHQAGVLGPALRQNVAHAIKHRQGGGKVRPGLAIVQHCGRLTEGLRLLHGIKLGLRQQAIGQRLQTKLPGNLALGAALLLERQINVFQLLLGGHLCDRQTQGIGELALLVNGLQNALTPILQLAQIGQALLQGAQLGIVQPTCGLLAVTRNERDGGPTIQ